MSARSLPVGRVAQNAAKAGVVARTVDPARLGDEDRRAGRDPLVRQEMCAVLRLVVVADVPIRTRSLVGLVDDPVAGVAEGVNGRDVDDARDAGIGRRIEQALGGGDVGGLHRRPIFSADADPVVAGEVEGDLAAVDGATKRIGVEDVGDDDLAAGPGQAAGRALAAGDGAHFGAGSAQAADEMAADEPAAAGDEGAH